MSVATPGSGSHGLTRAKSLADGAYCHHLQRPLARRLLPWVPVRLSANGVTLTMLVMGLSSALLFAWSMRLWLPAVALWQLAGVASCLDGEVARRARRDGPLGDLLDNAADRAIEASIYIAICIRLHLSLDEPGSTLALLVCAAWLAALGLLINGAEHYRSAFGRSYPKRTAEPVFSWITAGSDARMMAVSVPVVAGAVLGRPAVALAGITTLAALMLVNHVIRITRVAVRERSREGS